MEITDILDQETLDAIYADAAASGISARTKLSRPMDSSQSTRMVTAWRMPLTAAAFCRL